MFSLPMNISKSVTTATTVDKAYDTVKSFESWPVWSPWLSQEPNCKYQTKGTAGELEHQQLWDGKVIGSGNMRLKATDENRSLLYDLNFLKPWKSCAEVEFLFEPVEEGCRITWKMKSSVPIFLFAMRKKMTTWIGADYDRGLQMLKSLLERGQVQSKVQIHDIKPQDGFHYVGKRQSCSFADIPEAMGAAFGTLEALTTEGKLPKPDWVLSFSHKWDLEHSLADCTCAYGYKNPPEDLKDIKFVQGEVPQHKTIVIQHFGLWEYLGNAWSAAISYQRAHKLKLHKSIPEYEVYENTPQDTDPEKISTIVHLPIR